MELLVVIGIIALLISVLLPALASARRSAQLTKCLATQRQIGVGVAAHAAERRGFFPLAGYFVHIPPTRYVTPELIGDSSRLRYVYTTVTDQGTGSTQITLAPWPAAVAQHFGRRTTRADNYNTINVAESGVDSYLNAFHCAAQIPLNEMQHSIIYHGGRMTWLVQQSYAVNEAVFGYNDALGRLRGHATRVNRPSETMMLADGRNGSARGFSTPGGAYNFLTFANKVIPGENDPITLADALLETRAGDATNFDPSRHRGKINILFFDGHAETRNVDATDLKNVLLFAR